MSDTEVNWEKYEPVKIPNNGKRYIIQDFKYNSSKDRISLSNEDYLVTIEFMGYTEATRITEDGNRLAGGKDDPTSFAKLPDYLGNNDFIFKGKNTDFINWYVKENIDIFKADDFTHYCIMDTYLVVDILAGKPKITVTEIEDVEKTSSDSETLEVSKTEFEEFQTWKSSQKEKEVN